MLEGQARVQSRRLALRRALELNHGLVHRRAHALDVLLDAVHAQQFRGACEGLDVLPRARLGVAQDLGVLRETFSAVRVGAHRVPGRDEDVLLQLHELSRALLTLLLLRLLLLVLLLLLLLLTGGLRFGLAEDLLERSHFGEEQVRGRAAQLAVAAQVLRPEVVREQVLGLGRELLEGDAVGELDPALRVLTEHEQRLGVPAQPVADPVALQAVVVLQLDGQVELLDRRHDLVAGALQGDARTGVVGGAQDEALLGRVLATVGVDQVELQARAAGENEAALDLARAIGRGRERQLERAVTIPQPRLGHGLVQGQLEDDLRALGDGGAVGVLDEPVLHPRVAREAQEQVRALELGQVEHAQAVLAGRAAGPAHLVGRVRRDGGQTQRVDRIVEATPHGQLGILVAHRHDERGLGRRVGEGEGRGDQHAAAALDLGVAGLHVDGELGRHLGRPYACDRRPGAGRRAGHTPVLEAEGQQHEEQACEGGVHAARGAEPAGGHHDLCPVVLTRVEQDLVDQALGEEPVAAVGQIRLELCGGEQGRVEVPAAALHLACDLQRVAASGADPQPRGHDERGGHAEHDDHLQRGHALTRQEHDRHARGGEPPQEARGLFLLGAGLSFVDAFQLLAESGFHLSSLPTGARGVRPRGSPRTVQRGPPAPASARPIVCVPSRARAPGVRVPSSPLPWPRW